MYRDSLENGDFDLAEVLAKGAIAVYGEENEIAKAMLSEITNADIKKMRANSRINYKYRVTTKIYSMRDKFVSLEPDSINATFKKYIDQARTEVGAAWDIHQVIASPFITNLTLVVSAPEFVHEVFEKTIGVPGNEWKPKSR